VARAHDRGDEPHVRAVAGREEDRRFLVLEGGDLALELLVELERARKDRRAGGAEAVLLDGIDRGLLHLVPVGDAEVVVGGHVDEVAHLTGFAVPDLDAGRRRRLKRLRVEVVAVREGLLVPLVERTQQVQGVVPRPVIEVAVVVLGKRGLDDVLLVDRFHTDPFLWGHRLSPPRAPIGAQKIRDYTSEAVWGQSLGTVAKPLRMGVSRGRGPTGTVEL